MPAKKLRIGLFLFRIFLQDGMDNSPDYGAVFLPGVEQVFYEITDLKLLSLIAVPDPVKKFSGNRLITGIKSFSFFWMQLLPKRQKLFFPNHL